MVLFVIGSLLAAWGPSFPVVLAGRVFQAGCTGILLPMVMTEIVLIFPREKRGSAMGLVGLLVGFVPTVGPTISGLLIDFVGWHALFLIVGVLGIVVLVAAALILENRDTMARVPFDALSVVLSSFGLLCMLYGLSTFASSDNMLATVCLIVVGVALLALFVRRQLKLENPMLNMAVFRSRRFSSAVFAIAIAQGVFLGIGTVLPLFIQMVQGQSAAISGLAVLPGALLSSVFALVSGKLFDRFGVRKPAIAGGIMIVASGVMLASLAINASFAYIAFAYAVGMIGLQLFMTPCNTWGINSLDNSLLQHANAVSQTVSQVSNSFMVAIVISLTALSGVMAPGAEGIQAAFIGDKIALVGSAAILLLLLIFIVFAIRDKASDEAGLQAKKADDGECGQFSIEAFMNPAPAVLKFDDTAADAAELFAKSGTSGLPVVDDQGKVVGFLSDGDLVSYLSNKDAGIIEQNSSLMVFDNGNFSTYLDELLGLEVQRIATKKVVSVDLDSSIEEACRVLAVHRIKKVPVMRGEELVGTLSRQDIIHGIARVNEARLKEGSAK